MMMRMMMMTMIKLMMMMMMMVMTGNLARAGGTGATAPVQVVPCFTTLTLMMMTTAMMMMTLMTMIMTMMTMMKMVLLMNIFLSVFHHLNLLELCVTWTKTTQDKSKSGEEMFRLLCPRKKVAKLMTTMMLIMVTTAMTMTMEMITR